MATSPSSDSPPLIDLLSKLTAPVPTGKPTQSDATALSEGIDPSSPDILKTIAASITRIKEGGPAPTQKEADLMGAAMKSHLDYNANLNLLNQLNKAYSAKYGSAPANQGTK